jgi:RNA polymerase sigma-70 factor (ECF subfamily)
MDFVRSLAGGFVVSHEVRDELLSRAQAGDVNALEAITRAQLPRVERLLRRMLGPRRDMDDLVQEVFLELVKSLHKFRGESSISTFVGGITVHVARRAMRPSAWQRKRSADVSDETESPAESPDDQAMAQRRLVRLARALEGLSAPHRIALTLWALEGLEPKTIAEMTGASLAATRSRIFYAQRYLREAAVKDDVLREWLDEREGGSGDAR